MRIIQLGFQLHTPYELQKIDENRDDTEAAGAYFASEESFRKADREIYQPFFALLERNIQKYRGFRFSLLVSGAWLEQAEKYDAELIVRLKKMVKMGRVELVALPYYHSLAFFYAKDELAEQVRRYQDQLERLFGVTGRVFALPELLYNDAVGKWAEEFGFAGMLIGSSARALDWRTPNRVYEAAGCEYLRLLVRNWYLSDLVERGDETLLVEKGEGGEKKSVLAVEKFRKLLDLDFLRGNLVNLYFDTAMFARWRERGIVGFFDELIATWLENENHKFVTAAEACVVETPTAELSIKETVSWRGGAGSEKQGDGLVLKKEIENNLPIWLNRKEQRAVSELIYGARRQILASEDEKLAADLRRLMLVDYHKAADVSVMAKLTTIVDDLKRRAEEIKKTQAVEISRAYTKKHDRGERAERGEVEDDVIKVRFGTQPETKEGAVKIEIYEDEALTVPVRRTETEVEAGVSVEEDETQEVPVVRKSKSHAVRKIIRKLVIE